MKITSRQNAWFKRVRDAIREHADEIVIEGPKAIADATAAGWKPIVVMERGVFFDEKLFDALSETKTNQGVIALFERPKPADLFARMQSFGPDEHVLDASGLQATYVVLREIDAII